MVKVLKPDSLVPSERVRSVHCVTPEAGTTLEEVMAPEYWRAVTPSLRAGDFIEVTAADGTYFADLRVWDVAMSWEAASRLAPQAE